MTQPYSIVSGTSTLSILWSLSSWGALSQSISSRVYVQKLPHALRMRRSTLMDRGRHWGVVVNIPPEVKEPVRCLYARSVASTLNMAVASRIPFVRKHMMLVLASDTVRPNTAHTATITTIIFLSCSGDCKTTPASSA